MLKEHSCFILLFFSSSFLCSYRTNVILPVYYTPEEKLVTVKPYHYYVVPKKTPY